MMRSPWQELRKRTSFAALPIRGLRLPGACSNAHGEVHRAGRHPFTWYCGYGYQLDPPVTARILIAYIAGHLDFTPSLFLPQPQYSV